MSALPFKGAERTEWQVAQQDQFFGKLESLFPQLDSDEIDEIHGLLKQKLDGYSEIAHYAGDDDEDPTAILVFEDKKVFIDILDPKKKEKLVARVQKLVGNDAKLVGTRLLTAKDWDKRDEIFSDDDED